MDDMKQINFKQFELAVNEQKFPKKYIETMYNKLEECYCLEAEDDRDYWKHRCRLADKKLNQLIKRLNNNCQYCQNAISFHPNGELNKCYMMDGDGKFPKNSFNDNKCDWWELRELEIEDSIDDENKCCENESRNINGGCDNCGDPSL